MGETLAGQIQEVAHRQGSLLAIRGTRVLLGTWLGTLAHSLKLPQLTAHIFSPRIYLVRHTEVVQK